MIVFATDFLTYLFTCLFIFRKFFVSFCYLFFTLYQLFLTFCQLLVYLHCVMPKLSNHTKKDIFLSTKWNTPCHKLFFAVSNFYLLMVLSKNVKWIFFSNSFGLSNLTECRSWVYFIVLESSYWGRKWHTKREIAETLFLQQLLFSLFVFIALFSYQGDSAMKFAWRTIYLQFFCQKPQRT